MARRLVPLTDEIKELSLLNVRTWDGMQQDDDFDDEAGPSEKLSTNNEGTTKVKTLVSKINKKSSANFDIFVTKSTHNAEVLKVEKKKVEKVALNFLNYSEKLI